MWQLTEGEKAHIWYRKNMNIRKGISTAGGAVALDIGLS